MSKSTLIIGASRGIGLGMAQALAAAGWSVTGTVREGTGSSGLHTLVERHGGVRLAVLDITQRAQIAALRQRFVGCRFDLLLLNAGVQGPKETLVGEMPLDDFNEVMNTNALGPAICAETFAALLEPRGMVLFMSSWLGSIGQYSSGPWEAYRASKAAQNMLAHSFWTRHPDLTVLSVVPGWVRTDMGGPDAPLDIATSARRHRDYRA